MISVFENRLTFFLKNINHVIENSLISFSITKVKFLRTVSFSFSKTSFSVFENSLKNTIL